MQKKNTIILYVFFIIIYPLFSQSDSALEKRFLQALELDWNGEDSLALEHYMDILVDEPRYSEVYSSIASLFCSPKGLMQGVEFFNSLLKSDSTNGYAYYGLAKISKYQENYKQALKYLKKCIALKPHFSSAYGPYDGLGSLYQTMENYNLAIKYYKEALTKKDYYKWFYIETSHRLYKIYDKLGKVSEAEETKKYLINLMNDLLTHYDSEPNIAARRFYKLFQVSNIYYELGNKKRAHKTGLYLFNLINLHQNKNLSNYSIYNFFIEYGRLYKTFQKLEIVQDMEKVKNKVLSMSKNLKSEYKDLSYQEIYKIIQVYGELELNLKQHEVSYYLLELANREDNNYYKRIAYDWLAVQELAFGDYNMALLNSIKSIKISETILNKKPYYAYGNLGILYANLGNYLKSIEYFKEASKFAEEENDISKKVMYLLNLGFVLILQKEFIEGLVFFKQAKSLLGEYRTIDSYGIYRSKLFLGLGDCFFGLKDYRTAFSLYQKALSASNLSAFKSDVLISVGYLKYSLKNFKEASEQFQKAYIMATKSNINVLICKSIIGLAECDIKLGKNKSALQKLHNVVNVFESTRKTIPVESSNFAILRGKYKAYHLLTSLLLKEKQFSKAFSITEKYKSTSMMNDLTNGNSLLEIALPDSVAFKIKKFDVMINNLHYQLSKKANKYPYETEKRLNLNQRITELKINKANFIDSIKAQNAYAYKVLSPETTTLNEIQNKFLEEKTVVIEYMVGDSSLIIFAIAKDSVFSKELPISRKNLENKLSAISSFYRFKESEKLDFNTNIVNAQMANFSIPGLYEAYKVLIKPLESFIKDSKELIIIPDDLLYYLPFEALVSDTSLIHNKYDFTNTEFMLEKYDISYSPSASLLNLQLQNRQNDLQFDVLALGNPDYSDLKINDSLRITSPAYVRGMKNLQPLLHAEKEVVTIGEILGEKNSKVFSGFQATEKNFKTHAANSRILHLATHFMTNDKDPMYSKIALAKNEASVEDGLLHPFEIFSMNLNAEMVVLSACNTALGKISKGEGIIGVSRAFQYAGIPSLVVSQWNVDDQATSNIMSSFYAYLKKGLSKNKALKFAKLDYLKSAETEFKNPFYWAPFILMGNQQPIEFNRNDNYLYWIFLVFLVLVGLILLHKRIFFTIRMH